MPLNWSPKQAEAIQSLGSNVLVSASAGAGKTTVLIGRLMKRMEIDRVSLDEIIAMTFTDLAAMEMRKRLLKELNIRIAQLKDDTSGTCDFLKKQVVLLPSAKISTIHSFCLSLVQTYAYVLKIDPAMTQNILDEAQKALLLDEAFDRVIREFSASQPHDLQVLLQHFDPRPESRETLKDNVFKMMGKINTLVDEDRWIDESLSAMDAKDFHALRPDLQAFTEMATVWKIDDMIAKADRILTEIPMESAYVSKVSEKPANLAKYQKALNATEAIRNELITIKNSLLPLDYSQFRQRIFNLQQYELATFPITNEFKSVHAIADSVKGAFGKILSELYEEETWYAEMADVKPRMKTLAELTRAFRDRYNALKIAEKAMDFDDMERFALKILRDDVFLVRDDFKRRYQEIMVDEFQDTNEVQNEIVELISNGTNIFRVGDVKQSIYRFRNAEPGLMRDLMTTSKPGNKTLYLGENYRSKSTVVEFNNVLFDKLMNFTQLPAQYTAEDHVVIGSPARQGGGAIVELHLLDLDVDEEEESEENNGEQAENPTEYAPDDQETIIPEPDPFAEGMDTADPKAKHIVNQILWMKEHTEHKKFSDYVVLVRTNDIKIRMKKVLEKAKVPHQVSVKTGFFNSDAVQDVLLMINHKINPHDDINFIGLCLSDFLGMNEADCAQLRLQNQEGESYYETFKRSYPDRFLPLKELEITLKDAALLDALRAIFDFNGYYDRYCTKQQRANLDFLFDKAQTFSSQNLSLSEFLLLLKRIDDEDSSEAIPFTEEDDVVRVMTIHQSKGLEFKVVFYWSQGKINVKDNANPLLMDSKLGFVLNTLRLPKRFVIKNPVRKAMEMKSSLDDVLEQVRVLYVALTRAEDKLILVDVKPKQNHLLHYTNILNAIGPTSWVLMAMDQLPQLLIRRFPKPIDPIPLVQAVPEVKVLQVAVKPTSTIEFKTPSSKHTKFTHFKLNFDQSIGANHGTLIHELFEQLPPTDVTEAMIRKFQPDISQNDVEAVLAFYDHPINKHCATGDIRHEFPFYALIGQDVLHGYMDMVALTADDTILIDFKTDRVDKKEILLELYTDQLKDYVKVLSQMRPDKPVNAYLYSLALKDFIEVK